MHELGLLGGVVAAVTRTAERAGATGVEAVCLRVGSLSGALPEALRGAWPMASAGTLCEAATLELELVDAAVWCPTCQRDQPVDEFFALVCPVCGTPTAHLTHGREFQVAWADLRGLPEDHAGSPPSADPAGPSSANHPSSTETA